MFSILNMSSIPRRATPTPSDPSSSGASGAAQSPLDLGSASGQGVVEDGRHAAAGGTGAAGDGTGAADVGTGGKAAVDRDLTARARIRDAAIACFAEVGVSSTSVRTIAAAAEVSPGLVIHHFGSKDRLRVACDQHVAALVRETKAEALAAGAGLDVVGALRGASDGPPVVRYLARTLGDGTPHVAELIDEMVDDATDYLAVGVEAGTLKPAEDLRGRAVVLVMWSLGALVLHEHVTRLTGADLTGGPAEMEPWILPAMEILAEGVLAAGVYDSYRAAFAERDKDR